MSTSVLQAKVIQKISLFPFIPKYGGFPSAEYAIARSGR